MPRQPFLPTYSGPTSMGPDLIEAMPKLANLVGRIAINWSGIDLQLSLALGCMIGVENPAAVAVFLSLRNHRAQRDALASAGEKSLEPKLKELLDAILFAHGQLDSQRNDVIHCIWGMAEKAPDGIIWESLQDHANMLITDYHSVNKVPGYDRNKNITKNLFVWRYEDLERLNAEIRQLADAIRNFHVHLRYPKEPAGAKALRQLCSAPLLQEAAGKLRKKG